MKPFLRTLALWGTALAASTFVTPGVQWVEIVVAAVCIGLGVHGWEPAR